MEGVVNVACVDVTFVEGVVNVTCVEGVVNVEGVNVCRNRMNVNLMMIPSRNLKKSCDERGPGEGNILRRRSAGSKFVS